MRTPIFGPFDVSRSPNLADNRLINLYLELVETKQGKAPGALYSTPGLSLWKTIGDGPIRAMHTSASFGLIVLSGDQLYQVANGNQVTAFLGGGVPINLPASIIEHIGGEVGVFSGNSGFAWSSGARWSSIALPFLSASPISATQQDGFGLITQPGTGFLFQSDLLDFTTWNPLNFGQASADPDNVVAVAQLERELWLLKNFHTEIWYNAGTSGFSFARLDGVYIETGIVAQSSLCRVGDSLMWLGRSAEGDGIVFMGRGHRAERVSIHGLEALWAAYPRINDATAYAYQQSGHLFYVLNFPSGNATWVFDATASAQLKTPIWHQRAAYNAATGGFDRHYGSAHASFNGLDLVGDYRNGNIYKLDFTALTDDGNPKPWLRTWRALEKPVEKPLRFDELRIDMQTGISVPDGTNPQVMLRWSDDGGHNWSTQHFSSAGKPGDTARRVMFRRMGSTRRSSGLDRIFELSSADQFPAAIVGANLEAS